jgi:hypothetical protein
LPNSSPASPAVFDWQYYLDRNPDLRAAGITTEVAAQDHWLRYRIREGRQGCATFWSVDYLDLYPDLRAAFDSDYFAALRHYVDYGRGEGRRGVR